MNGRDLSIQPYDLGAPVDVFDNVAGAGLVGPPLWSGRHRRSGDPGDWARMRARGRINMIQEGHGL